MTTKVSYCKNTTYLVLCFVTSLPWLFNRNILTEIKIYFYCNIAILCAKISCLNGPKNGLILSIRRKRSSIYREIKDCLKNLNFFPASIKLDWNVNSTKREWWPFSSKSDLFEKTYFLISYVICYKKIFIPNKQYYDKIH